MQKIDILNHLVCPECKCDLIKKDGGILRCSTCGNEYPIINGIPRFVKDVLDTPTTRMFGYEWRHFSKLKNIYKQQFLDWLAPIGEDFFRGKVVMDAGCGKGRHLYWAAQFGAKGVIGVDASSAVDVAGINVGSLENVYIVNADITRPPFGEVFDYIYSIGVIHHLNNPEDGVKALAGCLKPDGVLSIWVYGKEGNGWVMTFLDPIRKKIIKFLPFWLTKTFSYLITLPLFTVLRMVYLPASRLPRNSYWRQLLFYQEYLCYISRFDFDEVFSIVFDQITAPVAHYSTSAEVKNWFKDAGLVNIHIAHHNNNSWRAYGVKQPRRDSRNL